MGLTVDQIESVLTAKTGQYVKAYQDAASAHKAWRDEDAKQPPANLAEKRAASVRKAATDTVRTEEQAVARVKQVRKAATDDAIADTNRSAASAKRAAKAAADAEIAEKRRAIQETRRLLEAESARNGLAGAGFGGTKLSAAQERAYQKARDAALVAAGATNTAYGGVSTIQAESAAGRVAAENEINHALLDRTNLQAGLISSTEAESAAIKDQLTYLKLINDYKRSGISEDEAGILAGERLAEIEARRAARLAEETALLEEQRRQQQILLEEQLRAQSTKLGGKISILLPAIIGGVTLHELSSLNDAYIKFSNSLKVAGVETANFDEVQDHLLKTANRTGTNINALADLYRSAALASKDLGASQEDLLKVSDAVANALRIGGRSSEEARGAILQLGHAFETGKVTAREFNGLALNLYPVLQAVAKGSDQYGGSVAKLRQALIAGDLTSKVFFQDLLKGADDLAVRASKASLTTAQGFTSLTNALTVYFGEADKAQGVSAAFGSALQGIANNLDALIPAISAIGVALISGYVVRTGAAIAATEGLGVGLLAAFGGPVGLAITAITLAIGGLAVASANAAAEGAKADAAYADLQDRLKATATSASAASGGVQGVGNDALGAIPKVDAFAGAVGNLAQQLYNQARAARLARIEGLQTQLQQGQAREITIADSTAAGRAGVRADNRAALARGDLLGINPSPIVNSLRDFFSNGRTDKDSERQLREQQIVNRDLQKQLVDARSSPITASDIPGGPPEGPNAKNAPRIAKLQGELADLEKLKVQASGRELVTINRAIEKRQKQIGFLEQGVSSAAANAAAAGGGAGRRGPSAETLAKRAEAVRLKALHDNEAYTTALKTAHDQELQADIDLSNNAEKRADLERQRITDASAELAKNIRDKGPKDARANGGVAGTGEYSAPQTAELLRLNALTADLRTQTIDLNERRRKAADALSVDNATDENKKTELQSQQQLAKTIAQRRDIALQLLDIDYKEKEAALRAVLAPDSNATAAEKTIATDRLNLLSRQKANDANDINRTNASPFDQFRDSIHKSSQQITEDLQTIEVQGINSLNDGLEDAIVNSKSLGDVFHNVAKQILSDLIKIGLQAAESAAFGSPGGGGGSFAGLISGIGSIFSGGSSPGYANTSSTLSFTGARAGGGQVSAGKFYKVNEFGTEGYASFDKPGKIVPLGEMNSRGGNTTIVQQSFTLDARYGITTPELIDHVNAVATTQAARAGKASYDASQANAPGRIRQYQTLEG